MSIVSRNITRVIIGPTTIESYSKDYVKPPSELKTLNKFLEATDQASTALEFAHKIKQAQRSMGMGL